MSVCAYLINGEWPDRNSLSLTWTLCLRSLLQILFLNSPNSLNTNKLKATWKVINKETGRSRKRDHIQYLIDKYKDQNVAEILNDYFLSIANKLTNTINNNQNITDTDYMPFMEHVKENKYPKTCNKPSTINELKKSYIL
jgi:hypothetical protein